MNNHLSHRSVVLASLLLVGSFLLSSCSLIGNLTGGGAAEGIKKVVASYLDDISDGTFTDDEYESEYADDSAFADLIFEEEDVIKIMDRGLTRIEYTIDAAEGSVKEETGTCDITVTAVDVEEVLSDLEDETIDADILMDAVKDKGAPKQDYEITLEMTYDSDDKVWIVSDSEPLAEILGVPYTEITFGPSEGDLIAVIDTFMKALAEGDTDTIDEISPYYDSYTFFPDQEENIKSMHEKFYGNISYQVTGTSFTDETSAQIDVAMSIPDIAAIIEELSNDIDFMATILKPYMLASIQGGDTTAAETESQLMFYDKLEALMVSSEYPPISGDLVFKLEADEETGIWELYEVPGELYDIDAEPTGSDELYEEASLLSLDLLLQDGAISQADYDAALADYYGETTPSSVASPLADIYFTGWYDYDIGDYVTSYDSNVATLLEFNIEFYSEWPGLTVYYDWYNENASTLCYSDYEVMESGLYGIYPSLSFNDGDLIPADTYELVVYLDDGTILADEVITVY